ncbi:hypothetical protein B0T14DRAFT_566469 [Immersiella caudata]|uniref:Uncharacterized protein n=1 Tax=Immersiella caudata TaxID=314043 RepID=A0AA40BZX6_9PEZI|nr:hypothetical protein B0T14DRAFT_566469 [Immersiella caudata]
MPRSSPPKTRSATTPSPGVDHNETGADPNETGVDAGATSGPRRFPPPLYLCDLNWRSPGPRRKPDFVAGILTADKQTAVEPAQALYSRNKFRLHGPHGTISSFFDLIGDRNKSYIRRLALPFPNMSIRAVDDDVARWIMYHEQAYLWKW